MRFRIAVACFSQSWGGLELMVTKLGQALSSRGHRTVLVSPLGSRIEDESRRKSIPHFPLRPRFKYLDFFAAARLGNFLRREKIQILITTQSGDVSTCLLARNRHPQTRVVFLQQMHFGHNKKDLFHRWAYGNLDFWVTLTETMKSSVVENTVVPETNIRVIPFGVNLEEFNPALFDKQRSRKKFNLPPDRFIVAVVGRFDRQKGQEFLIHAAPHVLLRYPHVHFVFVGQETSGEPGYLGELQKIIADSSLSESFQFLPFTSEMPELLAAIDVLALTTRFETFGYILLEAMAMGKPVIGTRAGGVPEIVKDGETGLLVQSADSRDLADKLLSLLQNQNLYPSLSRNARPWVASRFDFRKNVDDLERVLADTLSSS